MMREPEEAAELSLLHMKKNVAMMERVKNYILLFTDIYLKST